MTPHELADAASSIPVARTGDTVCVAMTPRELADDELRRMWREAGGEFYGPRIETGTMPESKLLPFLRSLALRASAATSLPSEDEIALAILTEKCGGDEDWAGAMLRTGRDEWTKEARKYARAVLSLIAKQGVPSGETVWRRGGLDRIDWVRTYRARTGATLKAALEACKAGAPMPSAPVQSVPSGWKLVPVEPTPKMVDATWDHPADRDGGIESQNTRNRRIYAAMLEAAPAAPVHVDPEPATDTAGLVNEIREVVGSSRPNWHTDLLIKAANALATKDREMSALREALDLIAHMPTATVSTKIIASAALKETGV